MSDVEKIQRRNKPAFCKSVRIGLDSISVRFRPVTPNEVAAIQWIVDSIKWHPKVAEARKKKGTKA